MKQKKQQNYKENNIDLEVEEKLKNQQEQMDKDFDPYKIDKLAGMPMGLVVFIIKWWFAGAIYYFAWMGIFSFSDDGSTEALLGGIILGAVMDLLINRIIRFVEREDGANEKYILVRTKKYYSFVINMLYCVLASFFITYGIGGLVGLIAKAFGHTGEIALEPISFGLMFYAIDWICLKIKHLINKKKAL